MIRRTKWFWLSATFPLSCPLSPYLQLLEVLLLHLLLCYNVRLVLNLVYLLRGAVRLNLRHYPGDRRLESRYHNLRGKLRRYLQLLASRQTLLSVGKPACQQATLLCLAGQSRYRGKKKKKGREIQQNEGWWQTTCYSRWLWWNITIELNEPRQEVSENKPRDNGYRFSYLKKTKACLFKFGGSALSWRPEARVGVKKKVKNWTAQSQRWEELSSQESDCSTPPSLLQRSSATPCKGWLHTPQRCPRSSTVDRMPTVRKIDTWLLIDTYGSFRGHSQWIQLGFPMQEPEAVLNNFNGYEEAKKKGTSILLRKGLLVADLHMVRH